jgi:hypothetical protein
MFENQINIIAHFFKRIPKNITTNAFNTLFIYGLHIQIFNLS